MGIRSNKWNSHTIYTNVIMKFSKYYNIRESIEDTKEMIINALGGNSESEDIFNAPIIQFAKQSELLDKLNSLPALQNLINNNPTAKAAIDSAKTSELTIGQLAQLLG